MYLRISGIPHEVVRGDHYFKSATLKLPFIQIGDKVINDSGLIISYLKKNFKDIDAHLTAEQKSISVAFTRLVEEHLYFGSVYFRWIYEQSAKVWLPEAFRGVPFLLRGFISRMAQKGVKYAVSGLLFYDISFNCRDLFAGAISGVRVSLDSPMRRSWS
eukprot:TRINITY_DN282_c0_g1_i2.p1 TRINITY_DN282_c0_g1~~TRINITY_DN282_c0_g1_i2.p1  ORF type:complete len:159 (+),score=30.65 TRINITY_DN282_c0_g1_i2:419-895(+)